MKYCFIVNPSAGKGSHVEKVVQSIEKACSEENADYAIFVSQNIEQTKKYVKDTVDGYDGELDFIACGGDGTLCETIISVMALEEELRNRVFVGVIPMGTGNDFASNFEDKSIFFNIEAQLKCTPYSIDLIKCNDMYSVNMVNVGFDSHVVCQKEKISKKSWVPGKLAYIISLVLTLIRKPGVKVDISKDGEEDVHENLLLTTFANGAFCGGGFNSNPKASLTDGNIDCITVENIGRMKFISLVGDYRKGLHLGEKFKNIVNNFKCRKADLYFSEETPVSIDGELVRTKELHLSVEKKALRFMLPKGVVPKVNEIKEKVDRTFEKIEATVEAAVGIQKAGV